MRPAAAIAPFACLLVLIGCGQTRRYGDDGGQPVTFAVHLERPFVKSMRYNQWRPSVGAGAAFSSGGGSAVGTGVGVSFSATEVSLLGGDGPAEAQVFIHELKWGDNTFTVPLAPGRKLHLTAKAEGGREGWEALGEITVPRGSDARVAITLDVVGAKVVVTPVEVPAAPAAASTRDGGPAMEKTAEKPQAGSAKPEATTPPPAETSLPAATTQQPAASGQQPDPSPSSPSPALPPPGEHADAGDKPPSDDHPPVKVEIGPAPEPQRGDAPQAPHPDPLGNHP